MRPTSGRKGVPLRFPHTCPSWPEVCLCRVDATVPAVYGLFRVELARQLRYLIPSVDVSAEQFESFVSQLVWIFAIVQAEWLHIPDFLQLWRDLVDSRCPAELWGATSNFLIMLGLNDIGVIALAMDERGNMFITPTYLAKFLGHYTQDYWIAQTNAAITTGTTGRLSSLISYSERYAS